MTMGSFIGSIVLRSSDTARAADFWNGALGYVSKPHSRSSWLRRSGRRRQLPVTITEPHICTSMRLTEFTSTSG